MACDTQAGLEAQKLISVSLGKMAASRMGRTGTSLHKSLLVASVLHRARHVFLEESYHAHRAAHPEAYLHAPPTPTEGAPLEDVYTPPIPSSPPAVPVEGPTESDTEDKENPPASPPPPQLQEQNVEAVRTPLAESNNNSTKTRSASLKRRRCVSQQETQEAVWSILPKRPRTCSPSETLTEQQQQKIDAGNSMEVEHITSLVSIFSFGGQRVDMCGTEAAREAAQFQPVALAV